MRTTLICAVAASIYVGFSATLEAQAPSSDLARGAEVYGAMCGRCHAARSPLERTDREWVTITNHMRVRANLTGRQMRAVLAFLQGTNSDPREAAPLPPDGPPQSGATDHSGPVSDDPRMIVQGDNLVRANACIGCHVIGRTGGNLGPALNGVVQRRGAAFVRQKLGNPMFNNATSMMPNMGLTPAQVEAIVAYLATLSSD